MCESLLGELYDFVQFSLIELEHGYLVLLVKLHTLYIILLFKYIYIYMKTVFRFFLTRVLDTLK